MTDYFSGFDYGIIAAYFLFLVCMGFHLKKRASASLEHYVLGARSLPWYLLGVSGMAWSLDMTGTMLIVSLLYLFGPRGLFIEFRGGANLVLIFMMLWAGKWHRRSGCMTAAEWNIYRFGSGVGGDITRLLTAVVTIVMVISMLAYMVKGDGLFLATFMPFKPIYCVLILISVAVLYTVVSGFYGVVFTDVFQCGIIVAAVIGVTIIACRQIGGYDGDLATLAQTVTGNPEWTSSNCAWKMHVPTGYGEFEFLFKVTIFYLIRTCLSGMGYGSDPRYFGARNERECGLLTFLWSNLMIFRWPMMMGFAVIGLFLMHSMFPDQAVLDRSARLIKQYELDRNAPGRANSPDDEKLVKEIIPKHRWDDIVADIVNHPENYPEPMITQLKTMLPGDWTRQLKMVSYEGTVNPERIVPAVLFYRIPRGFRGLLFVALIAASMSTFNSFINWATGLFTKDIYQAFVRPRAGTRELIWASYGFGLVLVGCGLALGYTTTSINNIWDWIIMGLGAGVGMPAVLRLYWWRFNAGGVIVGTLVGLVAAILQHWLYREMPPEWKFIILTTLSMIGIIVGTYLTAPTDRKVLEHFYKTTRPFGFWGPFRHLLSPAERAATKREHFYDIICVPFGLAWQVCLFLMPMQLLVGNNHAFRVTLVIFLISLAFLYQFWYKKLPPPMDGVANPGMIDGKPNYPKE